MFDQNGVHMEQNKLSMTNRILAGIYWFIVVLFSTLAPGVGLDTRNFSYMGPYKFWEFNGYILFILGAMLVLGVVFWRNKVGIKTIVWMAAINALFVVMNLFDILHFFPNPAQPMPAVVMIIEVITSILALGILACVTVLAKPSFKENSTRQTI
jgi:hypothetical protein